MSAALHAFTSFRRRRLARDAAASTASGDPTTNSDTESRRLLHFQPGLHRLGAPGAKLVVASRTGYVPGVADHGAGLPGGGAGVLAFVSHRTSRNDPAAQVLRTRPPRHGWALSRCGEATRLMRLCRPHAGGLRRWRTRVHHRQTAPTGGLHPSRFAAGSGGPLHRGARTPWAASRAAAAEAARTAAVCCRGKRSRCSTAAAGHRAVAPGRVRGTPEPSLAVFPGSWARCLHPLGVPCRGTDEATTSSV